jgi:hypothetical protein
MRCHLAMMTDLPSCKLCVCVVFQDVKGVKLGGDQGLPDLLRLSQMSWQALPSGEVRYNVLQHAHPVIQFCGRDIVAQTPDTRTCRIPGILVVQ